MLSPIHDPLTFWQQAGKKSQLKFWLTGTQTHATPVAVDLWLMKIFRLSFSLSHAVCTLLFGLYGCWLSRVLSLLFLLPFPGCPGPAFCTLKEVGIYLLLLLTITMQAVLPTYFGCWGWGLHLFCWHFFLVYRLLIYRHRNLTNTVLLAFLLFVWKDQTIFYPL